MRDLDLRRNIPLVGLGALVFVGCGGRSLDGSEGANASEAERLSDENFHDSLLESFENFCVKQIRCDYSDYNDPAACAEYYADTFDQAFDLDSRACRRRALAAIDCLAEQRGCDYSDNYACEEKLYGFIEQCRDYNYDYDY